MSTMMCLLFGVAILLTVAATDAAVPPQSTPTPPCNYIKCSADYICLNSVGGCVKEVIKPGVCPMYACVAEPINPTCPKKQCQHDGECPGRRKCCWGCNGCNSCLSVPLPSGK